MKLLQRKRFALFLLIVSLITSRIAEGTQADDTTITITGQSAGASPFIAQLNLLASQTSVVKSVQFAITPKPDSVTRPVSATYSNDYLVERGNLNADTGEIFVPVYGLYADFSNTVVLTYHFMDGSSKQDTAMVTTTEFDDPCGYTNPTVLQARTDSTSLSYDYMFVKGQCSEFSPAIIDTDGVLRWVGPGGISSFSAAFFDNAFYIGEGTILYRIDLDGTITPLHDYSDTGVIDFHHNIERGKNGLMLEVDTAEFVESINIEADSAGNILKTWNLADIISAAMLAGGDDPSEFVFPLEPSPNDWFHNNGATYNRAEDSVIISSRENFLICLDYETLAIKWILGDPTKKWHQFPSLAQYALDLPPGSLPPIGQHAPSITFDQNIMVFDNGLASFFQQPPGETRSYASPRKYQLDLDANLATEIWNFEMDQSILSPICSSVYEDAPFNYLIDYAIVGGLADPSPTAQLLGLDAAGNTIFYYGYPTAGCNTAYNSFPIHLENTSFPTVGPQVLNLSTRGMVASDEGALIGGFIVAGTDSKSVVLRALGPSLAGSGVSDTLADPAFTLYDASGAVVTSNDDWEADPGASEIAANGLAPSDPAEAAAIQTLAPGAYTFVVTGKDLTSGIGLVEAYDLSPLANSKLANLSTRGAVGTGDDVLISGFIVGEVASNTVVIRAVGPSLAAAGIANPLSDPMLTVYDSNGAAIASNDNWQDDLSAADLTARELAPTDAAEAATILHLPAGAYTTIANGAGGATGIGLVEIFDL
jgi:arylsulfate sulfotransferase